MPDAIAPGPHSATESGAQEDSRLFFVDPELESRPRVLVTFLGTPPDEIEPALQGLVTAAAEHGELPIFLVSEFCFDLFRARDLRVEYLPPAPMGTTRPELVRYERYILGRFGHLAVKWGVTSEVRMGLKITDFVANGGVKGRNDRVSGSLPD